MKLIVYSVSRSFANFLGDHLGTGFELQPRLQPPSSDPETVYLLHISGMELDCYEWLLKNVSGKPLRVAVCSDLPSIRDMLECVRVGAKAYCNSHMASLHYRQMLRLLSKDQSWFPPNMLDETFKLVRQAASQPRIMPPLEILTGLEKEIALAVAEGRSNRQIADLYEVSEPTVKTHLTDIFRKLELKDRVGLVLYLKHT